MGQKRPFMSLIFLVLQFASVPTSVVAFTVNQSPTSNALAAPRSFSLEASQRPQRRSLAVRMGAPVGPQPFRGKIVQVASDEPRDNSLAGRWLAAGGPRWATLLDEALFLAGSLLFVAGSFDFFPGTPLPLYVEGCELYIVGSAIFLGLALYSAFEIWEDAKLDPTQALSPAIVLEEFLYIVGSTLFLAGTVLFIPPLDSAQAASASLPLPLPVPSLEDLTATALAAGSEAASSTFSVNVPWFGLKSIEVVVRDGSPVPKPSEVSVEQADLLFVAGSILFSVAAFVSALKAVGGTDLNLPGAVLRRRTAVATASLYELGGVAFVVGTLGFIPAPVLGISACPEGEHTLTTAGATLFVAGSLCYTMGSALTFVVTCWLTYADLGDDEEAGMIVR
mmetsp:Transcript_34080/g.69692  ORF Transcript_34080/g.69692 Transcript_34080/m.69692 type:complete len:393 (-) Transcript_34080:160-1338(-)